MRIPIIKANIAVTKTAAAAISFMILIFSLSFGSMKSHSFSIEQLSISKEITTPEIIRIANHSIFVIEKKNPVMHERAKADK